jgi:hypothetical protein
MCRTDARKTVAGLPRGPSPASRSTHPGQSPACRPGPGKPPSAGRAVSFSRSWPPRGRGNPGSTPLAGRGLGPHQGRTRKQVPSQRRPGSARPPSAVHGQQARAPHRSPPAVLRIKSIAMAYNCSKGMCVPRTTAGAGRGVESVRRGGRIAPWNRTRSQNVTLPAKNSPAPSLAVAVP